MNYLAAEAPIIDKIRAAMPELVGVFAPSDLAGVTEGQQLTPAVHVVYYGDRVVEGSGRSYDGAVQTVDQLWYAILVVRNSKQVPQAIVRQDAGPLAHKLLKSLQGFAPTQAHSPLRRVDGVPPGFKNGFGYLPFLFSTRITL